MKAIRILWNPRGAARAAAETPIWISLATLGAAAAYANYPLLLQLTPAGLAQAKLDNTPQGMTSFSVLVFLGMWWAAPVLLPLCAWVASRAMRFHIGWVLDLTIERNGVSRITACGFLPVALGNALTGTVALLCGGSCDRFNPVATNLAFFLDPAKTDVFWYEMARGVDVFSLWAIVATSLALGKFAEEKPGRIWPGLAALWVAALVLRALLLA